MATVAGAVCGLAAILLHLSTLANAATVHEISWGLYDNAANSVSVSAGDVVIWRWDQSGYHNLVGLPGPDGESWGELEWSEKGEYRRVFSEPGEYFYYCEPHHWYMSGTITVAESGAPAAGEAAAAEAAVAEAAEESEQVEPVTREYFVRAEEIDWDYAPTGRNECKDRPFAHPEMSWATKLGPTMTGGFIGTKYRKAVFRGYTDGSFTERAAAAAGDEVLGILGPPLRAVVGDTLSVTFSNGLGFAVGMRLPIGAHRQPTEVEPGATVTYTWRITAEFGPGPADASSVMYLYRGSQVVRDTAAGLVGPLIVTRRADATDGGRPVDVDQELINVYWVVDENQSPYLEHNYRTGTDLVLGASAPANDANFAESNSMYSVNGYIYCGQPEQRTYTNDRVRWYVGAVGVLDAAHGAHTPHYHGNTWVNKHLGNRGDEVEVIPGLTQTLDMVPDAVGVWMAHCHVNHHIHAGMITTYTVAVRPGAVPPAAEPRGVTRTYYVAADEVEWDYAPAGVHQCGADERSFTVIEQGYVTNTYATYQAAGGDVGGMDGMDGGMNNMDTGSRAGAADSPRSRSARHPFNPDGFGAGGGGAPAALSTDIPLIGSKYLKAVYREYTDATFTTLKPVPPEDQHKGLLGPVLRAEVGDTLEVVFRNHLPVPSSLHPHGVFYPKNAEGATYKDGSQPYDRADDSIASGHTFTYVWPVPERAGPSASSAASSAVWLYHSHVDETADVMAGLVGPIVVVKRGMAMADGRPRDVDREMFAFYQIFDESQSLLFSRNTQKYLPGLDLAAMGLLPGTGMDMSMGMSTGMDSGTDANGGTDSDGGTAANGGMPEDVGLGMDMGAGMNSDGGAGNTTGLGSYSMPMAHSHVMAAMTPDQRFFHESNRMHAVNGYVYCNHPQMELKVGDRVRWYALALGNQVDAHTAQWEGQTVKILDNQTVDSVALLPSTMMVADQVPDECGMWQVQCAVATHADAGMALRTSVIMNDAGKCWDDFPVDSQQRIYYIAAEQVEWDYIPSGENLCTGTSTAHTLDGTPWTRSLNATAGSMYQKARFRRYTDMTYTTLAPAEQHDGVLGPTIRAEVGDSIVVLLLNRLDYAINLQAHGLNFGYWGGNSAVEPGTGAPQYYVWVAKPGSGPDPADTASSRAWLYHSSVRAGADVASGLFGTVLIYRPGALDASGKAADVDQEYVLVSSVTDETASPLVDESLALYAPELSIASLADPAVVSSFHRYAFNGRSFCNLPPFEADEGELVRWHMLTTYDEQDVHSISVGDFTVSSGGHRMHAVDLFAGTSKTVDMLATRSAETEIFDGVLQSTVSGMVAALHVRGAPSTTSSSATGTTVTTGTALAPATDGTKFAAAGSSKACGVLGWRTSSKNKHYPSVCGASKPTGGICFPAASAAEAGQMCRATGARLCSAAELAGDVARGSGCGYDKERVWAADLCDGGQLLVGGSSKAVAPPQCHDSVETGFVRCCADLLPKSVLSCTRLPGVDLYGSDLWSESAASAADCAPSCLADPACSHFTHVWGKCWYKSGAGNQQRSIASAVSGDCSQPAAPATPSQLHASEGCKLHFGIDFFGADLWNERSQSVEACSAKCAAVPGCTHFTHLYGRCYYKTSTGAPRQVGEAVSGVCSAAAAAAVSGCSLVVGTDFYGADLFSEPAAEANTCVSRCQAEPACSHFSFVWGRCWFKSGGGTPRTIAIAVSGVCG